MINPKLWLNRTLKKGLVWQIILFSIINVAVFLVALAVFLIFIRDDNEGIWHALCLFVGSNDILHQAESPTLQTVIKILVECCGTILFSGLIVAVITNVIEQKLDQIKEGHVHYRLRGHVVIIGYDAVVPSIVSAIIADSAHAGCRIVLQTGGDIDSVRHDLLTKVSEKEIGRLVLIHAPRMSVEELKLLYTVDAREIFIVGDRMQSDHDAENMHTFEELVKIHTAAGARNQVPLTVWFENEASYAAMQLNDISAQCKLCFDFRPYNFYKRWANRLLTRSRHGAGDGETVYPELDHDGIGASSGKHVHLIIIGMNRMGVALAKEAAHLMHFPNFNEVTGANRTRITFIDDHADTEMNFFRGRHAGYFNAAGTSYADLMDSDFKDFTRETPLYGEGAGDFLDVRFEFIKGRVESPHVRKWLQQEMAKVDSIITIAICLEDPSRSLGMAMYLPEEVYLRGRGGSSPWEIEDQDRVVNIFVRQEKTGALLKSFRDAANVTTAANRKYANLYPFGMVDGSFDLGYHTNQLAMAFNYIYDFYFKYDKTLPSSLPSADDLKARWKELPISHKWSNLYLADSIEFKLRSIGLDETSVKTADISEKDRDDLARTEHSRWNMEKLLLGYRPLAPGEASMPEKDKKQYKNGYFAHCLIKPYKDLGRDEKELDMNIIVKLPDIIRMIN